ncbi:MAG: YrhK family protein [Desulfohalobiaceae bacterium]
MPHMFTNRPRRFALLKDKEDFKGQFRWESINAALYKLGGLVFILGSIMFLPSMQKYMDLGCWIFFFGSLLYLVVTVHDLAEVYMHWKSSPGRKRRELYEYTAAVSYVTGTVLFALGSIFFLSEVGWNILGGWCFIIGSLLFVLAAGINVLQIVRSRDMLTLQLMNLTAVSFVVGSVLFTVASVPTLWEMQAPRDHVLVQALLGWQYLVGSMLFFLGGIFNYWRAYIFMSRELSGGKARTGS